MSSGVLDHIGEANEKVCDAQVNALADALVRMQDRRRADADLADQKRAERQAKKELEAEEEEE